MSATSWHRFLDLLKPTSLRRKRKLRKTFRRKTFRPVVELLEDRTMLATIGVNSFFRNSLAVCC